ncbi:DNA/RNA non-specific endonuclease, partial [Listeria innocua]|nr:DNA/RNA non-specific endonuclease [Listeria innocua]
FTEGDLSLKNGSWQKFSDLDSLNRVGEANAMLHNSMMPQDERESLYINPTGWKNKKTRTGWLYNRAHLVGFQLTGENNNPKNLMTATRSLNTPCMLEYENRVADYLHETNNHVRYRVTPIFKDNELVARGVEMQAQSIEDDELQFHVYIFNVEENIEINYQDGTSKVERIDD